MIGRLIRGAMRRAVMAPIALSPPGLRAEAVAALWDGMDVRISTPAGDLVFFAPTPLLRARAHGLEDKEPDTIAWLDQLPTGAVLWDIGANVGAFTVYAAAVRRCTVLAFEPSAANYEVLTRNLHLNALDDRVHAYCLAFSGGTGLGVLNLDSPAPGTAMSQFGKAGERSRYATSTQPFRHGMVGFSIDDFVRHFAPPRPTHLKLDVDGLECAILQGAASTLQRPELRSVMVELSVTDTAERQKAIDLLHARGLALVSQGMPQGDGAERAANHLFLRA